MICVCCSCLIARKFLAVVTIIINFFILHAVAIVIMVSGEGCASVISDADVVAFDQPVWKGQI
jgi:hypothetical protein